MPDSRYTVGNVEIIGLTDIEVDFPMPLTQLFPHVPAAAWAAYQQRYPEVFPRPDTWHPHFGGFLLRSQGRTILVDTGIGSSATNPGAVAAFTGGAEGHLLEEVQAIGVRPEDVDTVFFTHLHPDHVGWNLSPGGGQARPTFPRARYVTHQADWHAFKMPEVQGHFPFPFWEETLGPLERLGVLDLLSGERALTREITAIPTPGHTPGSMSLAIVSGGQRALIIGDITTNPAQVTEPDWVFAFDMDPALAVQTRKQMIERAEAEEALLIACHFPHPGHGRLIRLAGRRYWQGGMQAGPERGSGSPEPQPWRVAPWARDRRRTVLEARRWYPAVTFQEGDAEELPFPDDSFDAVVVSFGLLHLGRPEQALAEVHRVLRAGGKLGFTVWITPEEAVGFGLVLRVIQNHGSMHAPLPPGPPFFRFSDPAECRRVLLEAGFMAPQVMLVPQV